MNILGGLCVELHRYSLLKVKREEQISLYSTHTAEYGRLTRRK